MSEYKKLFSRSYLFILFLFIYFFTVVKPVGSCFATFIFFDNELYFPTWNMLWKKTFFTNVIIFGQKSSS